MPELEGGGGPAFLINGLGGASGFGETFLSPNDDGSTGAIDIQDVFGPGGLNFFGTFYNQIYVNNNGNITFTQPLSQFNPSPIGTGLTFPIIAPYWYDIDTRSGAGEIGPGRGRISPGGNSTGSNVVWIDKDVAHDTITITWDDVGYYSGGDDQVAAFQLRIIHLNDGDFEFDFIYEALETSYGDAARSGFSPGGGGNNPNNFELPGSGPGGGDVRLLASNPGNTQEIGIWRFTSTGGGVQPGGGGGGDDDAPFGLEIDPVAPQNEGDTGLTPFVFTVHFDPESLDEFEENQLIVHWEIDADPSDLAFDQVRSGDIFFDNDGGETRTVTIFVRGDTTPESDEPFTFKLTSARFPGQEGEFQELNVAETTAILDDDGAVIITAGDIFVSMSEGNSGITPFVFHLNRAGDDLSLPSTVHWVLHGADPSDLAQGQPLEGDVVFGANQTSATVTINVAGDRNFEPDDIFTFRAVSVTHDGQVGDLDVEVSGIIRNDDALAQFAGPVLRGEGRSGATPFDFILTRTGDLSGTLDAQWRIDLQGADAQDFAAGQAMTGTATFQAGSAQAVIRVMVAGDTAVEPDDAFLVRITSVGGVQANTPITATGTILDDDSRPTMLVAAPPTLVQVEGSNGGSTSFSYMVVRVGDTVDALTVPWAVIFGEANSQDFSGPLSGSLTFAAGATEATFSVLVTGDNILEASETFSINVGGVQGLNTLSLTGVILNDDKAGINGLPPESTLFGIENEVSSFMQNLMGGWSWSDGLQ